MKYYMASKIIVEIIPKLRNFNASDHQYQQRRNRLQTVMKKMESLKVLFEREKDNSARLMPNKTQNLQPTLDSINREKPLMSVSKAISKFDNHSSTSSSPISYDSSPSLKPQSAQSNGNSHGAFNRVGTPGADDLSSSLQAKLDKLLDKSVKEQNTIMVETVTIPNISCVETFQILSTTALKVLFFDVRPIQDFIVGHMSWKSILKTQPGINGGVINMEPEWLESKKTPEELHSLLGSFGSKNTEQRELFGSYQQMDMIIFYDESNRSSSQNSAVTNLFHSLPSKNSKQQIRFLSGGFRAWQYHVKSDKNIFENDWVEIGTGTGMTSIKNMQPPPRLEGSQSSRISVSSLNQTRGSVFIPERSSSIKKNLLGDTNFADPFFTFGAKTNYQSLQKERLSDVTNTLHESKKPSTSINDELRRLSEMRLSEPKQILYPSLSITDTSVPTQSANRIYIPRPMDSQRYTPSPPMVPPKPQLTPERISISLADTSVRLNNNEPLTPTSRPALPPKPAASLGLINTDRNFQNYSTGLVGPPLPPKPSSSGGTRYVRNRQVVMSPISFKLGISGLRNLGNTCFMNSILQCVTATLPLTRYFLGGHHRKHIARNNPLSSGGRVVEAFTKILQEMVSGESTVCVPSQFKDVIGDLHPVFGGNEQQDSQEFLSFILDQLHEDLNVAKRPFPENGADIDSENYSDSELLKIENQKYFARNWSIIVDMFQGILKSRLQCLSCGKVSFN